jgi:hypothetical protein
MFKNFLSSTKTPPPLSSSSKLGKTVMPPTSSPEKQLQAEVKEQELSLSSRKDEEGIPELILPTPSSMIPKLSPKYKENTEQLQQDNNNNTDNNNYPVIVAERQEYSGNHHNNHNQQPHHNRSVSIETTTSQTVDLPSLFNNYTLHQTHHQRQVQHNQNHQEETMMSHDRRDGNDSPDSGSLSLAASQVDSSLADDDLEGIAMGSDHSNGSNTNEATTDTVPVVVMSGSHDLDAMIDLGKLLFRDSLVVADNGKEEEEEEEEEEERGNDDENTKNNKDKTMDAINTAVPLSSNNDDPACTTTPSSPSHSSSSDNSKSSSSKTTTIGRARMMMMIFAAICIILSARFNLLLTRYTSDTTTTTTTLDSTTVFSSTDIDIDIDAADRRIMYPVSNHSSKYRNNEECMNDNCHNGDNDDVLSIATISSDTTTFNTVIVGDGGAIMKDSTTTSYILALNCHNVFDFARSITLLLVACGLWWGLRLVWISSSSSASITTNKNETDNAKKEPTTPSGHRISHEGSFLTPPSLFKNSMVEPMQYMSPCYGDGALDISRYEAMKSDELRSLLRRRKGDTTGSKSKLIRKLVTLYQSEFACLTVHQLRPKLRRRNLLQGGKKEDIIRRLVEAGPI